MELSIIGFAAVLLMSVIRIPIAFSMASVGIVGYGMLVGWEPAFTQIAHITTNAAISYDLSVVPLFVLMGIFVTRARLSDDLFTAAHGFLGHHRGGLAMATVVACGGFGAICGSSVATAATMAKVAIPSMRRFGYSDALASGSIAAGGTLGILIPPSIVLVIYGLLTQESIGKLFAAGIVPGVVAILCYAAAVRVVTQIDPKSGPKAERLPWRTRLEGLKKIWGVLALFALVMGGIYGGIFEPTEAAGIGAFGALVLAVLRGTMTPPDRKGLRGVALSLARGRLDWRGLFDMLLDAALTTGMLFVVLIGALLFANFVNEAGLPDALKSFVTGLDVSPWLVIWAILLIYIILGCVFESISMVLLTVPVFFPIVQDLGFNLVWFGIVVVCVTELSLITPPVGINIFVLRAVLPDVKSGTLIKGVLPFCVADIIRLAILVHIPWLSLVIPDMLF